MRWNCPHCSIELFIDDNRIGNEWSFSRCYSCGGFSLVRKSNVNTIKIEQAPTPQTVLQPSPMIAAPEEAPSAHGRSAAPSQAVPTTAARISPSPFSGRKLPPPLPDKTTTARMPHKQTSRGSRWALPAAIGMSGLVALGSGIYLYIQGQELWKDARGSLDAKEQGSDALHLASKKGHLVADTINRSAMAPERQAQPAHEPARIESKSRGMITVKLTRPDVNLRIGPGLKFPIIGKGDHTISYTVVEWRDEWFKVAPNVGPVEQVWVRNDFVRTVRE